MANPILKMFLNGASSLPKMQRIVVPQPTIVLAGTTTGRAYMTAQAGSAGRAGNMAHIPFRRFALRAIGATISITQGTTFAPALTTVVGGTDTLLVSAAIPITGSGNRGTQFLFHVDAGKSWVQKPGAAVRTYDDTYKLSLSSGRFFALDATDTNFPSTCRGQLPRIRTNVSATGTINWYVVVDVLVGDL